MKNEIKKRVIFDFDGVLADTEEISFKIHKDVNGSFTWEKFQELAEGNFHERMQKSVTEDSYVVPKDYYKLYEEGLSVVTLDEIIRNAITKLSPKFKLAIVSATTGKYISKFLEKENILKCFDDILGHEVHTSKVVKINTLLKKNGIIPQDAVLITDTLGDILEANKCEVKTIGVTWGLHTKETLEKGNPSIIIDDPRQLLETIEKFLI